MLPLVLVWFLGAVIASGILLAGLLNHQAQLQITTKARLLMDTMASIRDYTQDQVNPLFSSRNFSEFYPQSVPSYAAQEVFQQLRSQTEYEDFFYKEAVLNPTNLRDKADGFETALINKIKQRSLPELTGFETKNGVRLFYIAEPIAVNNPSCLKCHSTVDVAPQSMLMHYGTLNGFGWKLNEIVGIRITYVPVKQIFETIRRSFTRSLTLVVVLIAVAMVGVYWFLWRSPKSVKRI